MPSLWSKEKTLEELQEEDEKSGVELSIEQKKAALKKLKENNLSGKSFGWNWKSIWNWFKTH